MKLNINAALIISASAFSSVFADMSGEPDCIGSTRLTATDAEPSIGKNRAICDEPYKLGISHDGVFALWKDGAVLEEYATGADTLEVTDNWDGTESFVSVYDDDEQLIWSVGCVDQPENTTAKLIVHNATTVVRFTKENRLWTVEDDGENSLDDRCGLFILDIGNGTAASGDDAPSTSPTFETSTSPTYYAPSASPSTSLSSSPSEETSWEAGGYNCDDKNPCTVENFAAQKVYFPAQVPESYVQCGSGGTCFVMDCGTGTMWDQELMTCVSAGQNVYLSLICQALNMPSLCP
mmetsp:Transcript_24655/g.53740  ORF Transcript_24655/g.53740 Transcript_24655/m.53740 type:complete len:293 (+) Transcript_24655:182-1060(+)